MTKSKQIFPEILIFMIGLFSTFELTKILGVTIFTFLLIIFSIYMMLSGKKLYVKRKNVFVLVYLGIVTISELMIFTIQLTNKNEWIMSSLRKYVLLYFLICTFFYTIKLRRGKELFFRGLYYSCLIEMVWCYLQLFAYKFANIDINKIIFGKSHLSPINGQLILSGLNSNAGILAPALFFLILTEGKWVVKVFTILLFFISGTSTMIICGCIILFLICAYFILKKIKQSKFKIKKKIFIIILLLVVIGGVLLLVNPSFSSKINEGFTRLFSRLSGAKYGNFTDGSTFTHTRYYTSVLYVLKNSKMLNNMFGYGIDCAGVPFVYFFEQYSSIIYVPESDPITFLYNYGIVGLVFVYSIIIFAIYKSRKIDWRYSVFLLAVMMGGVFYGMYLNWVLLVTWLIADSTYETESLFFVNKNM